MKTFDEFWPFYMSQHKNKTSRGLHIFGTTLAMISLVSGVVLDSRFFIAAPFLGYFFAWVGHFGFEKNKPATFKYPLWSLRGDFKMTFKFYGSFFNRTGGSR